MGSLGSRFQSSARGPEEALERQCAGNRHSCECRKRKRSSGCECDSEPEEEDSQLDTPRRSDSEYTPLALKRLGSVDKKFLFLKEVSYAHSPALI